MKLMEWNFFKGFIVDENIVVYVSFIKKFLMFKICYLLFNSGFIIGYGRRMLLFWEL